MFILTYSSPTTGEVVELFATRADADAEAADVRRAMEAVGYGAYSGDCVRVRDTADMPDVELWDLPDDVQARIVAAEWDEHDRNRNTGRTYDAPEHPPAERIMVHVETPTGGYAPGGYLRDFQARRYTIADWDQFIKDSARMLGLGREGYRCVARNEYGDVIAMHVFG